MGTHILMFLNCCLILVIELEKQRDDSMEL